MINEQVLIETVQRMLDAGIDEPTIISTLVDTGISTEDANGIIQKVKTPKAQIQEEVVDQQQNVQILRNVVEAQAQQTVTHNVLDEHGQKLDEMNKKVEEVKQVIQNQASPQDPGLSYRISALEAKLEEVNAASKATLDLLQKILETNRKILTELEAKK
jgi:hypothetical protein